MAQLKDLIVNGSSRLLGLTNAPTPAAGTNDTEVATTAFVKTAVDNAINNAKQEKSVSWSTSAQTVTPDANKILSKVTVGATPVGAVKTPAATKQQSAPSISVDSNGLITASVAATSVNVTPSVTANGYVDSSRMTAGTITMSANSNTKQLSAKGATTYNTSTSDQTISSGQYLTGTQTIKGVTTGSLSAGNVRSGATITVGDANDADRIAGVAGTFSASSTVSSGQSAASAGNILSGKSAFLDGAELKGSMANNGTVSKTLTSQGASYTIPAGYHSGSGTVTASLSASSVDNTIISGQSVEEATGDYGYKVTVALPTGYHNAQNITKTFSSLFPAPDTPGTADKMLAGYKLYDGDGRLITGTMPNNGATGTTISTQGGTYSIPAGYTSGGTVTASINSGTITSGAGSASATTTVAPGTVSIAKTTDGNVSTGTVTTSKPSSGYYVATKATAAANTTGATSSISGTVAAPSVGTAGYVSSSTGTKNTNTVSGTATAKTSAKDSSVTYVPISTGVLSTSGSVSVSGSDSIYPGTNSISKNSNTNVSTGSVTTSKPSSGYYVAMDASTAQNTGSIYVSGSGTSYASVSTEGYVTSSQNTSGSISGSGYASVTVPAKSASTTYVPITTGGLSASGSVSVSGSGSINPGTNSISKNSSTNVSTGTLTTSKPSSGYYVAVDASTAQNTGSISVSGTGTSYATVSTGGYVTTNQNATGSVSGSGSASVKVPAKAASTTYVPITSGTTSKTDATASASVSKNPSASTSVTGMETTTTDTGYKVTASAASGVATASVTASSASVTAGYTAGVSTSTTAKSATSTEKTASDSKFIIASSVTNNTTLPSGSSSSGTVNRGSYIKFGKGYNPTDKYYQAQADAHSSYTPSSTYFQTSTSGAVRSAKINANQYATSDYYVKSTSASKSGGTVSWGSGWISSGSQTVSRSDLGITDKGAATYNTSTSDQTIAAGYYLTGAQTIKAVTTSGISASNIIKGAVVKVGDANSAGRIANVTGTADYIKTVTSVPSTKDTSIIYNSTNGKYYIWK